MSTKKMVPPAGGGQKTKLENLKRLPAGLHPAILFGICSIGTHETKYGAKPKIILFFEFPLFKQRFYQEDTEDKPKIIGEEMNYNLFYDPIKKTSSRLADLLGGLSGDDMSKSQIDISEYLGRPCIVNVKHNDTAEGQFENIVSAMPFNKMMIAGQEEEFKQYNDDMLFDVSFGFDSEEFGNMYRWVQEKAKISIEGLAHLKAGGTFAEFKAKDKVTPEKVEENNDVQQEIPNEPLFDDEGLAVDDVPF